MDGWQVDYPAAVIIIDRLCFGDAPETIRRLEAIKAGFAEGSRNKKHQVT